MKRLFLLPLLLISCQPCVHAIDEQQAVKCLLGEYESGTLTELTATAEAMRNRIASMGESKALKGVYGCKAVSEYGGVYRRGKRIIPSYAVNRAVRAWEASKTSNLVRGASSWESTDFKRPYWAKSMVKTATIGKHEYFRVK